MKTQFFQLNRMLIFVGIAFLFSFVSLAQPTNTDIQSRDGDLSSSDSILNATDSAGSIIGKVICDDPEINCSEACVSARAEGPIHENVDCEENGIFHLTGLPPNTYRLYATHPDRFVSRISEPIQVGAGQQVSGIELKLDPPPKLTGRVIDKMTGEGIPGVKVTAVASGSAVTDRDGKFSIPDLKRGVHRVSAYEIPAPYLEPEPLDFVIVNAIEKDVEGVILELIRGATVKGKVISQSGKGVRNASVQVMKTPGNYTSCGNRSVHTHKDGIFELTGLRPSVNYQLMATSQNNGSVISEPFSLKAGEVKEELVLQLKPFVSVSGSVKDENGNHLSEGFQIEFSLHTPGIVQKVYEIQPDDKGLFDKNKLPAGDLSILLYRQHNQEGLKSLSLVEKRIITAQAGQEIADIDFIVSEHAGRISGYVLDDLGNGMPDKYVSLFFIDHAVEQGSINATFNCKTNKEGRFMIEKIPVGDYDIWVSYDRDHSRAYQKHIECPTDGLKLVMPRIARVYGKVVQKSTGEPVSKYQVGLFTDHPDNIGMLNCFQTYYNPDGDFGFGWVPATSVQIKVKVDGYKDFEQTLNLKPGEVLSDLVIEIE